MITTGQHAHVIRQMMPWAFRVMETLAGTNRVWEDRLRCVDYHIVFPTYHPGGEPGSEWTWEPVDESGESCHCKTLEELRERADDA